MADNKDIHDGRDRSKVSATDDYEVRYLAEKYGVTADDVRAAIQNTGSTREAVEEYLQRKGGNGR